MKASNVIMFSFLFLFSSIAIEAKSFNKLRLRQQQQVSVEQQSNSTLSSMLKDAVQLVKMNEKDSQTTWAKDHYELEENITTLNQEINYLVTSTKDAETQLLILDNEIHDTKAALERYQKELEEIDGKILDIEKEDIKNNELKEDLEKKYNDVIDEIEDLVEKISVVSQEDLNKMEESQENTTATTQENQTQKKQNQQQKQQKQIVNQSEKKSKIGSFELPVIGDMFNFIQKESNQTEEVDEEEDIDEEIEEEDDEEKKELMSNIEELSKLYDELKSIMKNNEDKEVEEQYKTALFTLNLDRFKLSKKIEETTSMVETLVENRAEIEKQYVQNKKELAAKEEEVSRLIKTKTEKQNEFNEEKAKRQTEINVFKQIIAQEKKNE